MKLSICVLIYGPFTKLHNRVMSRLAAVLGGESVSSSVVQDIRIGLHNAPYDDTQLVRIAASFPMPVTFYDLLSPPGDDYFKYPTMRKMLSSPIDAADGIVWFDDDAVPPQDISWFNAIALRLESVPVLGAERYRLPAGLQSRWLSKQPWFTRQWAAGVKQRFPQGSVLAWDRRRLAQYDWPFPWLRHCGGDFWLGTLCEQQQMTIGALPEGCVLNADMHERTDASERRGFTELPFGVEPEALTDYSVGRRYDLTVLGPANADGSRVRLCMPSPMRGDGRVETRLVSKTGRPVKCSMDWFSAEMGVSYVEAAQGPRAATAELPADVDLQDEDGDSEG